MKRLLFSFSVLMLTYIWIVYTAASIEDPPATVAYKKGPERETFLSNKSAPANRKGLSYSLFRNDVLTPSVRVNIRNKKADTTFEKQN